MSRGRSLARGVPLLALVALLVWNALWFWPFVVDDAFISMRYARNLVAGQGLVYNPGQRVEGYSNFLWVLVEAGLLRAGWPLVAGVQVLGLLAGASAVGLTFGLARQVADPSQRGPAAWIAAGLLAANTSLALWSVAGLETSLLAALLVAAVWRFERELARGRAGPGSALLLALAWMTRPEAPAYLLYFLARRLAGRDAPRLARGDLVWVLTLAALVVPYELFGLVYYGSLFPATHAAKVGGGGAPLSLEGLLEFARGQGWGTAALLAAGGLGCALGWRRWARAAWVPLACGLFFAAYAGTDWMPRFRFFVPCLPFLCLSLAHGLLEWRARARGPARTAWALALAVLAAGYAQHQMTGAYTRGGKQFGPVGAARGFWPAQVPGRLATHVWPQEGPTWWILQNVPAGETVAIGDIGFPGFVCDNPIWDLRGLVTPAAAAWRHDRSPAASAALLADLRAARPAAIWIPSMARDAEQPMGRFEAELAAAPWVRAGWRRREDSAARAIVYLRRDLAAPDRRTTRARFREALARLPEYDSELARQAREIAGP